MMPLFFVGALCFMAVAAAVSAVFLKDLVAAVIASGAVGLLASIVYLFVAAPDVAMTEAAIGSGLTTVVFLYAVGRIRKRRAAEAEADRVSGETTEDIRDD
jgi:uncharacterized MnhB-related membrane protein